MTAGQLWYLGADGLWHRRGSFDVPPGQLPPTGGGGGTQGNPLFQIADLSVTVTAGTGGGGTPTPPPPPPSGATYFGACPTNPGGSSLAAATTVVTKFGAKACVRQFMGTAGLTLNHPTNASRVHASWNMADADVNSGSLDSQIAALVAGTPAGDVIEHRHESDNDGLSAAAVVERVKAKTRFYTIAKATKPSVLVAHTMTGSFWYNSTSESVRDSWLANAKGDLLGFDYDGLPNDSTYGSVPDTEIANVLRTLTKWKANGWQGWTVPEFCMSRQPADTDGSKRKAWMTTQAQKFVDGGAYMVCWYDYDTAAHNTASNYNHLASGTPEYTLWRQYVASNPA